MISCVLPADRLLGSFKIVHGVDFGRVPRIDSVAANFTVDGEQTVFRRKCIVENSGISNLPVMRKFRIYSIERGLNGSRFHCASNQCAEIPAPISDHYNLLRRREKPSYFL